MREDALKHYVCTSCHGSIYLERIAEKENVRIKNGTLVCSTGQHRFQLSGFLPRFILTDDATSVFGFEWNKHPRTQFDSVNGMGLSEERFSREMGWPRDLSGKKILEVGKFLKTSDASWT